MRLVVLTGNTQLSSKRRQGNRSPSAASWAESIIPGLSALAVFSANTASGLSSAMPSSCCDARRPRLSVRSDHFYEDGPRLFRVPHFSGERDAATVDAFAGLHANVEAQAVDRGQ